MLRFITSFFFFKQKTAYELRISDWSSDVCSSDLVVSTGVGGGIVLDGRLLDGAAGNAGHIGHVIVEPEGRLCGCSARGCLEAEASGSAIAARIGQPAADAGVADRNKDGRLVGRAVATAGETSVGKGRVGTGRTERAPHQ